MPAGTDGASQLTYAQFLTRTLSGVTARWPTENFPTKHVPSGTHIGLMQVKLVDDGIGAAWNWLEITSDGAALFQQKLATALRYETRIRSRHTGLRELTGAERENMAVLLYGPGASTNLRRQYYMPTCIGGQGGQCRGGTWDWTVNDQNPIGVNYVIDVRSSIR